MDDHASVINASFGMEARRSSFWGQLPQKLLTDTQLAVPQFSLVDLTFRKEII